MKNTSILIVEDDTAIQEMLKLILQPYFNTVFIAADSTSANKLFLEHKETIAALLIDYNLNGDNGIEIAKRFRSMNPDLPVVVTSGFFEKPLEQYVDSNSGVQYLAKPFTPQKLLSVISDLGDLKR